MARLARLCPIGVPQHVVQHGNNRQVCFNGDKDMAAYAGWLKEFSARFQVKIHAWVFMTNHVHLLLTPASIRTHSDLYPAGETNSGCYSRRYF